MIDLHCHLLPGVDDGARTLEDSLAMAQQAVSEGISHILVTPHHKNGKYLNPKEAVVEATANLQAELNGRGIGLTLSLDKKSASMEKYWMISRTGIYYSSTTKSIIC